jgi:hypothetical protein
MLPSTAAYAPLPTGLLPPGLEALQLDKSKALPSYFSTSSEIWTELADALRSVTGVNLNAEKYLGPPSPYPGSDNVTLSPITTSTGTLKPNVTDESAFVYGSDNVNLVLSIVGMKNPPLDSPIELACIPFRGIAAVIALSFTVLFTSGVMIPDGSLMLHSEFAAITPLVIFSSSMLLL